MVHVSVVTPPEPADAACRLLREYPSAGNLVRLAGAAQRSDGDLTLCRVGGEDATAVVAELREPGLERDRPIALAPLSSLASDAARR